jgi:hypothetical protein
MVSIMTLYMYSNILLAFEQAHCSRRRATSHIPCPSASCVKLIAFSEAIQLGSKVSSMCERLKKAMTTAPVRSERAEIWKTVSRLIIQVEKND